MRGPRIVSERQDCAPAPGAGASARAGNATGLSRAWRWRIALVWGALGFVAGASFWHVVGLWSFLSDSALDRGPKAQAAIVTATLSQTESGAPNVVLVDADRCTTLSLDRRSNVTVARPCTNSGLQLRLESDGGLRDDLAALAPPPVQAAGYRAN
jgi:hypothetical protein